MAGEAELRHQQLDAWARSKFGALVDQYKPTPEELLTIEGYYRQHPGASTAQFVSLLSAQRAKYPKTPDSHVTDSPVAPTTAKAKSEAAAKVVKDTATGAALVSGQPGVADAISHLPAAALDPKGPNGLNYTYLGAHRKDPEVVAYFNALKGGANADASAILDQFKGDTPVYIVGPATSQIPTPGGQHKVNPTGGITSSTYQEVLTNFYKMTPDEIRALKQQLWDGGFYPSGTDKSVIDSGTPDVATKHAYTIAIEQAARLAEAGHQTTVEDVIAGGNPDPETSTGASTIGPYNITNPADLKEALTSAAQERLGRDLSKDEIATFAKLYQGMESQSSLRYQAANRNNQQTAITSPASPAAAAQDYLDQHFADQEQGYGAVQRQQAFFSMLGPVTGG